MNKLRLQTIVALSLALALLPAVAVQAQVDTGSADFSRYVSIGDSLTQGFTNGGVFQGAQANSYPALVARQAGVSGFEQPLVSSPGIPALLELRGLVPPVVTPGPGNGQPINLGLARPYDNLGVSGFEVGDVLRTVTGNPIIDLTLRGLGTVLQQALSLQPTFATVWIGNNDALAAATSGIVINDVTLTSVGRFEADYRAIIGAFQAAGVQLAVANIPDVTAIPFVSTLPPVLVDQTGNVVIIGGAPVPLIGPNGPLGPGDKVLLTASGELAAGRGIPVALGGSGQPLSDNAVLDAGEVATISARIADFNLIIRQVATEAGAAFYDANAFFNEAAAEGLDFGGISLNADFLTGGLIGYDGVHPTPLGYAITANGFIEVLNEHFGADIPQVGLAPFVFGPEGAGGIVAAAQTSLATFTDAAYDNLRRSLGVPSPATLRRIKAHGQQGPGPGDGDQPVPGGGDDTPDAGGGSPVGPGFDGPFLGLGPRPQPDF